MSPGRLARALLLGLLAAGCDDYDHLEICRLGATLPSGYVSLEGVELVQGQAVPVKLVPRDDAGEPLDAETSVWPAVDDPDVLAVERLVPPASSCGGAADADWYFVLTARTPGLTLLRITVDDVEQIQIPVHVSPPD